jgi:hypothetical protein
MTTSLHFLLYSIVALVAGALFGQVVCDALGSEIGAPQLPRRPGVYWLKMHRLHVAIDYARLKPLGHDEVPAGVSWAHTRRSIP